MNLCKNCGVSGVGDLTDYTDGSGDIYGSGNPDIYGGGVITPPYYGSGSSSGSGINLGGAISSIASSFTSIFKAIQPLPAGCTQVAGAYGMSTQCSGTGTVNTSTLSLGNALSGSGSSMLLLGGAALLVVMMMKK